MNGESSRHAIKYEWLNTMNTSGLTLFEYPFQMNGNIKH